MFCGRSVRLAVNSRTWNPTQAEWQLAAQCVQNEEKHRIGKFIFKKDAKSAMVGRLLLRYGVSKMLDVPYRSLKFCRTEKGKPYLTSPAEKCLPHCELSFNISHQGDFVVFAAEKERLVGVDIMKVEWPRSKPVSEFFDTLERQLTTHEWKEVKSRIGDMEQLKTFFRLWCLKESLVKAWGTGIGFEVNRLSFHFGTPELASDVMCTDTSVEIDGEPAPDWSFHETLLADHCVAVAVKRSCKDEAAPVTVATSPPEDKEPPKFHVMDVQELLSGCEPLAGSSPDREYWEEFSGREEEPGLR
ncbi:L-aminoadipate-semialdehyde dehydrogenase-phosphopantetheinyl transferase [Aplysia californica]|uniref:L-aminoadipate-semialdehyde dehydrogenase-phosphopantetheinyl transferase n=1 Tax=Aplysia californica TaxID=6500 RepID=A0ABM0ZXT2_APLCA|nr:L-aminoadipate-semialdehyde dehydrogenase-phosphopantetheinyl transferase [Aplysia californica]